MEHLIIDFEHGESDIMPYFDFIKNIRATLKENGLGLYLRDDLALDGGDAEVTFSCHNAKALFDFIKDDLSKLSFMRGAKVTFVFGEPDSGAPIKQFQI